MIPPREQWCIQIEVTNACPKKCSNCTRLVGHVRKPFFMTPGEFATALDAVADFPAESEPHPCGRKVIGMMGGEPLIHPKFPELCRIMTEKIPDKRCRGLWTSRVLRGHKHEHLVRETFGYLNHNTHEGTVMHSPVLVAVEDVIQDEDKKWKTIGDCWLQEKWSSSITPKGFFFCEVAAAMDMVMEGPGGIPVEPGCWRHDLADYREQIEEWCPKCGVCLELPGRLDSEEIDDMSISNVLRLGAVDSPRVLRKEAELFDVSTLPEGDGHKPWQYMRGK
jgi:hypothetical protein